jgi:quercetin dioxygenase-like cupin family protein
MMSKSAFPFAGVPAESASTAETRFRSRPNGGAKPMSKSHTPRRLIALAGVVCATMLVAPAALAGECPANKHGVNVTKLVTTPAQGVTDTVLASIDLAKEPVKLTDHLQRLRKLVVQPGGVVPWHSHDDRPALIYIIEGEIVEYASTCAVPIVHKAGEVTAETKGTAHWWKNLTDKPVTLLSFDILHDKNDHNM